MTGHGSAHRTHQGMTVTVEIRTVNSRYFKCNLRSSEGFTSLEPRVEAVVRKRVRRGTAMVSLQVHRLASADDFQINGQLLLAFRNQIESATGERPTIDALLALPGVVAERNAGGEEGVDACWPLVSAALEEALEHLSRMRAEEGAAMKRDLQANRELILEQLAEIQRLAPGVVEAYRGRLTERLNLMLAKHGMELGTADVVREVGVFAERADIAEEIVRLASHLDQFEAAVVAKDASGRKLDFLVQEMFRETNTIGSKCNDAEISQRVVEIKSAIERMREMIQNIE